MPDVYGKYSLTEVSKELNVMPSFINRVQRETGIGGDIGTKGKTVSFDEDQIKIFRRVKGLRWFGFTFEEVKHIWELENVLITQSSKIIQEAEAKYPTSSNELESYSLIINPYVLCEVRDEEGLIMTGYEDYGKLLNDYAKIIMEVVRRRDRFYEETKKLEKEFGFLKYHTKRKHT